MKARERYRLLGLCVRCGADRDPGSTAYCGRCLRRNRDRTREANRRRLGCFPWRPGGRGRPPIDRAETEEVCGGA